MTETSALEALLERDRAVVLAGLAGVSLLAWAYLVVTAVEMGGMPGAGATAPTARGGAISECAAMRLGAGRGRLPWRSRAAGSRP